MHRSRGRISPIPPSWLAWLGCPGDQTDPNGEITGRIRCEFLAVSVPTGGLAGSIGRRRVLAVATGVDVLAWMTLLVSHQYWALVVVFALHGVGGHAGGGPGVMSVARSDGP